jgi:hypothetical protein
MTRDEAQEALHELNGAIGVAVSLIRSQKEILDRFFAESESMASIGPILDPTLFNSSERRAVEALVTPVYRAAQNLLSTYDEQQAKGLDALAKVKAA